MKATMIGRLHQLPNVHPAGPCRRRRRNDNHAQRADLIAFGFKSISRMRGSAISSAPTFSTICAAALRKPLFLLVGRLATGLEV